MKRAVRFASATSIALWLGTACGGSGSKPSTETSQSMASPAETSTSSTAAKPAQAAAGKSATAPASSGVAPNMTGMTGMTGMTSSMGGGGTGTSSATPAAGSGASTSATAGTNAALGGAPGMASAGSGMAAMDVPEDGDPTKPMVEIPGLKCGVPTAPFQTTKITARDVAVAYPCAHEGAPVTFFLFIHGTLNEQMKISFTMNAYAVHELVDSHNLIVVTPKSVVNQWGNGDNGVDLPHLYDVVNWTYDTFGPKFNIKSMWAHGGSWGAAYLNRTFACDPMFEKRLNGVLMVVGPGCPSCSDRMSCVVIQEAGQECSGTQGCSAQMAEMLVDNSMIAPFAMQHGCGGKMGPSMIGPMKEWDFPNCNPGWYHAYYLGPGQHADKLDQMAVVKITEAIKATEKK